MVKKSKAQAQAASASKSSRRAKPAAKSSKLAATKSGKLAATQVSASKVAKPKVAKSADKKDDKKPLPLSSQTMPPLPPPEKRLTKTYLSPADLKHFEKILLQKRTEVLRDLEIMRSSFNEDSNNEEANSSYSMHMADHGTETMDKEQHFMFIQRDEKYLGYIDKALERIKNNTYGICVVSGLPIPKERLEAVPHTAVRIEYKNKSK